SAGERRRYQLWRGGGIGRRGGRGRERGRGSGGRGVIHGRSLDLELPECAQDRAQGQAAACARQHLLLVSTPPFSTPGNLHRCEEDAVQEALQLPQGDGVAGNRDPQGRQGRAVIGQREQVQWRTEGVQ
ncbi:unnamed protein product, partial [Discosporangium mesarthrocarpum]